MDSARADDRMDSSFVALVSDRVTRTPDGYVRTITCTVTFACKSTVECRLVRQSRSLTAMIGDDRVRTVGCCVHGSVLEFELSPVNTVTVAWSVGCNT